MSEVDGSWAEVALIDVADQPDYGHTASAVYEGDGPLFVRITDLQDGVVDWAKVPRCECDRVERYQLQIGDLVVARTGATTGKSYAITQLPEQAVFASYLVRIRPSPALNQKWIAAYFQSAAYWQQIEENKSGSAQPGVNASKLAALKIPVAPRDEQDRIIAKLDRLRARSARARDELGHIPKLIERYKQAILAKAFSNGTPDEMAQIGDVASLLNGDRSSEYPSDGEQRDEGYCLFLGTRNVLRGSFDFSHCLFISQEKHECLRGGTLQRGDIVLTIRGTLGNSAVYDDNVDFPVVRINSAMIIVRPKHGIDPAYLMWSLRSPTFMGWIGDSSRGSAQPHLRAADIKAASIRVRGLSLTTQRAVVAEIERAFAWLEKIAAEHARATHLLPKLDQAILAKAFRGELVPQDPNDEPASVLLERIKAERDDTGPKRRHRSQ
jgi:type I restriction enzyme S subunit